MGKRGKRNHDGSILCSWRCTDAASLRDPPGRPPCELWHCAHCTDVNLEARDPLPIPSLASAVLVLRADFRAFPIDPQLLAALGVVFMLFSARSFCAKSLQLCLTLCDPMGGSPPGSSVHGIL